MTNYFLMMLQHLHEHEEVLLYSNLFHVPASHQTEVMCYLHDLYAQEALGFPHQVPAFDQDAALWGAHLLYSACQLLLYRENKGAELSKILPVYGGAHTASAMLSVDLSLRFLPDVIAQAQAIDPDDPLIEVLAAHLKVWHFSGVNYELAIDKLAYNVITSNACLKQLYIDRIIKFKKMKLATHQLFVSGVKASLGWYAEALWRDFAIENSNKS